MATITMSTATSIELQDASQSGLNTSQDRIGGDDIGEASRIVDAGVPEGGYGWWSLAACGVLCFWFVGTTYCWGIVQNKLVEDGLSTASTLSWVGSITIACNAIFSVLSARVLRSLGSTRTAFLGVTLLAGGEILAGFCTKNIGGLFVTEGVVMGTGVSLSFIVVGSNPSQYFFRRRGIANGIVFACGGLGGAVISFLMEALIEKVGTAWTLRILGFMTIATGYPAAWFVRDRVPPSRRTFVDWQLFKDSRFLLLFLAGGVATFPLLVPPFFLPIYGVSMGLPSTTAAALVAAFNFSSALGRIGAGFAADKFGPLNMLATALFFNGLSLVTLWPFSTSLAPLVAFSIINGAAGGGFFSLMPTVAGQVFGSARVSVALGMLVSAWSFGYLMGAPIAGYLLAAYGGQESGIQAFRPAMYYASSLSLASSGLVVIVRARMSRKLLKKL